MVKLHLGCGKRYLGGWVHIDLADFDHIDFRTSIDNLSNFNDETVDLIYCSHALEYFDQVEAQLALREWRRVLSSQGWLYLAVPDLNALITIYQLTGRLDSVLGPMFGKMRIEGVRDVVYHKTIYDETSLSELMRRSGFRNIEVYDPVDFLQAQDTNFDDHSLAFYPHMDRNGIQVSLCLRGQRSL